MIINGKKLTEASPFKDMVDVKVRYKGTSYGLSEAGYDIQIAEMVEFTPPDTMRFVELIQDGQGSFTDAHYADLCKKAHLGYVTVSDFHTRDVKVHYGRFTLASAIQEFTMPNNLVATVKDKSTWARQGLSVFNTVAEPGWNGFLTLELVFQGNEPVRVSSEQGIAQVLFDDLAVNGDYADGKYQNQERGAVKARS